MSSLVPHRWPAASVLPLIVAILLVGCAQQAAFPAGSPTAGVSATDAASTASPSATSLASPSASAAPRTSPAAGAAPYNFPLLPPGSTLPSEAFCAAHVQRSAFEPRPDNNAANARVPTSGQIAALSPWNGAMGLDPRADQLRQQMTGRFTGTTDEILQWVACKWGVPVNVVRAQAVVESHWHQNQQGDKSYNQSDCPPGTWNGISCYQSYGILQIKYKYYASAWPMSRDDTAFSAEYMYGMIRTCYEGWTTYLHDRTPQPGYAPYAAGDLWGCLGRWYSGGWYDQGAIDYIAKVKTAYNQKVWTTPGF